MFYALINSYACGSETAVDQTRHPVHRTILAVDVEKFGDPSRTDLHRRLARAGLYGALRRAFNDTGVDWDTYREDRGDGVFFLFPPELPKATLVEFLLHRLVAWLLRHIVAVTEFAGIDNVVSLAAVDGDEQAMRVGQAIRQAGWDQVPWVSGDWPPLDLIISIRLTRTQWRFAADQARKSLAVYEELQDNESAELSREALAVIEPAAL